MIISNGCFRKNDGNQAKTEQHEYELSSKDDEINDVILPIHQDSFSNIGHDDLRRILRLSLVKGDSQTFINYLDYLKSLKQYDSEYEEEWASLIMAIHFHCRLLGLTIYEMSSTEVEDYYRFNVIKPIESFYSSSIFMNRYLDITILDYDCRDGIDSVDVFGVKCCAHYFNRIPLNQVLNDSILRPRVKWVNDSLHRKQNGK